MTMIHQLPMVSRLLLITALVSSAGCVRVKYDAKIDFEPPTAARGIRSAIDIDYQASYIEIASDSSAPGIPSARYDRVEILSAMESSWNDSTSANPATPARVIVFADLTHEVGDATGAWAHSLTGGAGLLFGTPASCATSNIDLAIQTADGKTMFGRGQGSACTFLYRPIDHKMAAVAKGINDAVANLEAIEQAEIGSHVARVKEIPDISATGNFGMLDRVVWRVTPTDSFPTVWGATTL